MVPPIDPRTQSPPRLPQETKPSNVNKMPNRNEVESRLSQIRDYIRITGTMMESLSQSSDL
ncbi:leucine-rich repeat-containing protein, partial [Lasius niger]